jgi:hypothetical protein
MYTTVEDAESGVRFGGSGFVVGYPWSGDTNRHHIYFVTNLHVASVAPVARVNRTAGGFMAVSITDWHYHPAGDDIAVAAFEEDDGLYEIAFLSPKMFVSQQVVDEYDVGPGDDVFMVSRFINQQGTQRNTPIVRQGSIAMMPGEPVKDGRGLFVEAYLVDMQSIAGHSGSPVFWHIAQMGHDPTGKRRGKPYRDQWLLGIDSGHSAIRTELFDENMESLKPRRFAYLNSGIAVVIPAWRLLQLLEMDELAERRAGKEADFRREYIDPPRVTLD